MQPIMSMLNRISEWIHLIYITRGAICRTWIDFPMMHVHVAHVTNHKVPGVLFYVRIMFIFFMFKHEYSWQTQEKCTLNVDVKRWYMELIVATNVQQSCYSKCITVKKFVGQHMQVSRKNNYLDTASKPYAVKSYRRPKLAALHFQEASISNRLLQYIKHAVWIVPFLTALILWGHHLDLIGWALMNAMF